MKKMFEMIAKFTLSWGIFYFLLERIFSGVLFDSVVGTICLIGTLLYIITKGVNSEYEAKKKK